jgi:hypothetical protein
VSTQDSARHGAPQPDSARHTLTVRAIVVLLLQLRAIEHVRCRWARAESEWVARRGEERARETTADETRKGPRNGPDQGPHRRMGEDERFPCRPLFDVSAHGMLPPGSYFSVGATPHHQATSRREFWGEAESARDANDYSRVR